MAFTPSLRYKSPDSSALLNLRFKDVFQKGFVTGGDITLGLDLSATVSAFVLVNQDGMVVTSDATQTLPVGDGVKNYLCVRARYVSNGPPVLGFEVLTATQFGADLDPQHLHVLGTIDLSTGGVHPFPPAASLSYVERNTVDAQDRSFWRGPVATMGDLPIPAYAPGGPSVGFNALLAPRHGDVRLVTGPPGFAGTFMFWDELGTQSWRVFTEVPVTAHQQQEHSNGITGNSSALALLVQPNTSSSLMVQPPSGFYQVDGVTLSVATPTSPTPLAVVLPSARTLLQVAVNSSGVITTTPRVTRVSGTQTVKIVDISDVYPAALGVVLTRTSTPGTGTLAWDGGQPVAISTGVYQLFDTTGLHWVMVDVSGSAASGSDTYDILASAKTQTSMLLATVWADNSGLTGSTINDHRVRGNVDGLQVSTDFMLHNFVEPALEEHPDGVVSGGAVGTGNSALALRIVGPVVAYVAGRRFVAPGDYTGANHTLPANGTRVVYIDQAGVLQFAAAYPAAPARFAPIATVVTSGGVVSGTPVDDRTSVLSVGRSPRGVLQIGAGGALTSDGQNVVQQQNGSVAGTSFTSGQLTANSGNILGNQPLVFNDPNVVDTQLGTTVDFDLSGQQPLNGFPSIIGSIRDSKFTQHAGMGVEGTGCTPTATLGTDTVVTIGTGVFHTPSGKKVTITSPLAGPALASNTTSVVYWDGSTDTGFSAAPLGSANLAWNSDLPFAIAITTGSTISALFDIRMHADGHRSGDLTVGSATPDAKAGRANFQDLKPALLFASCFAATGQYVPKRVTVRDLITGAQTINASAPEFLNLDRLQGLEIQGQGWSTNLVQNGFQWGTSTVAFLNLANRIRGLRLRNLSFTYTGVANAGTDTICALQDVGSGFTFDEVKIDATTALTHCMLFTTTIDFTDVMPSQIRGCSFRGTNATSLIKCTGTTTGHLSISGDSILHSSVGLSHMFELPDASDLQVSVSDTVLSHIDTLFFQNTSASTTYGRTVTNCQLLGCKQAGRNAFGNVNFAGCLFGNNGGSTTFECMGADTLAACRVGLGSLNQTIKATPTTTFVACQFNDVATTTCFTAPNGWDTLSDCQIGLGSSGVLTVPALTTGVIRNTPVVTNTTAQVSVAATGALDWDTGSLKLVGFSTSLVNLAGSFTGRNLVVTKTVAGSADPTIFLMASSSKLVLQNCNVTASGITSSTKGLVELASLADSVVIDIDSNSSLNNFTGAGPVVQGTAVGNVTCRVKGASSLTGSSKAVNLVKSGAISGTVGEVFFSGANIQGDVVIGGVVGSVWKSVRIDDTNTGTSSITIGFARTVLHEDNWALTNGIGAAVSHAYGVSVGGGAAPIDHCTVNGNTYEIESGSLETLAVQVSNAKVASMSTNTVRMDAGSSVSAPGLTFLAASCSVVSMDDNVIDFTGAPGAAYSVPEVVTFGVSSSIPCSGTVNNNTVVLGITTAQGATLRFQVNTGIAGSAMVANGNTITSGAPGSNARDILLDLAAPTSSGKIVFLGNNFSQEGAALNGGSGSSGLINGLSGMAPVNYFGFTNVNNQNIFTSW